MPSFFLETTQMLITVKKRAWGGNEVRIYYDSHEILVSKEESRLNICSIIYYVIMRRLSRCS